MVKVIWMNAKFVGRAESMLLFSTLDYFQLQFLLSKWRTFTGRLVIWQLKNQQQKTSLLFCLVPEQRATVYGGLSISHPLCRLCPYLSCFSLTSALGSVGSIFQMKKQKKRSYSLRVLVDFSFLPPPQGAAVGLDPPMEAHLPFHQGCFIPENGPSHHGHLPLLRGRDRGVMGVTP